MLRRIFAVILGGLAVLLVLLLGIILIYNSREFFGDSITWLLVGCVGIIMVFIVYLMISSVAGEVRRRRHDEEKLSEKHIEKILNNESARQRRAAQHAASKKKRQIAIEQKREQKRIAEETKAIHRQEEFEAKQSAEEAARLKALEEDKARQVAEAEAKAKHIAAAEKAARKRAEQNEDEEDKRIALAEAEALSRAASEARKKLAEEQAERRRVLQEEEEKRKKKEEETATRKAQAVASARKQAEAAATARRRAAQQAAHTQTFAAIEADTLPEFNIQVMGRISDVATPINPLVPPLVLSQPRTENVDGGNLWEKMNVRQSAAPVLRGNVEATGSIRPGEYGAPPLTDEDKEDLKPEKKDWTYAPAKLPQAWKTDAKAKRIPGDMAYVATNATQEMPQLVPQGRQHKTEVKPSAVSDLPVFEQKANEQKSVQRPKPVEIAKPQEDVSPQGVLEAIKASEETRQTVGTVPAVAEVPQGEVKRPRGRPPKPKDPTLENLPKRPRGRPPKPKDPALENLPKRPRGRPPKPKDPALENLPKRPRGRPRKNPE